MRRWKTNPLSQSRRGFILPIVIVVLVVLTYAAYNYSGTMLTEHEASMMNGRAVSARAAAESAVEMAATRVLERDLDDTINLFHDPSVFQHQQIFESANERGNVLFSILTPDEAAGGSGGVRFGLGNENAKFNVNLLLALAELESALPEEEQLGLVYLALENIPGMTEQVIDSTLDWMDSDDEVRPQGAESDDYQQQSVPYEAPNAPMKSIDELLKVQGVTPELFYGEDANNNGILDPNENDGDQSLPDDNADGVLDLGWRHYLTASSRERNTNPDGDQKIDLNGSEMTKLFDAVEAIYGADAASFVVALRIGGAEHLTQGIPPTDLDITDIISREGIDLTVPPTWNLNSVYDLIGVETNPVKMVDGTTQTFTSPWAEGSGLNTVFAELELECTLGEDTYVEGRIDINQAREAVLMAIPGIPDTLPASIIAARPEITSDPDSSALTNRRSAVWLLDENLVDLETLRSIGPYITTRGDVFRFQTVGYFGEAGPTIRLEAMIDATVYPPKVSFVRDVSHLGRGYRIELLSGEGEQ